METCEKIYCYDREDNNNALAAANAIISIKEYSEYIKNNTSYIY